MPFIDPQTCRFAVSKWLVCLMVGIALTACAKKVPDRIIGVEPAVTVTSGSSDALTRTTHIARSMDEYRLLAAMRIQQANPSRIFQGPLPDPLASIPVLEVQLARDGSVRHIEVLRKPKFHPETVELAKQAILAAQPFGPVGHLPQPWRFNETFLYNDDMKFQLHTLVQAQVER